MLVVVKAVVVFVVAVVVGRGWCWSWGGFAMAIVEDISRCYCRARLLWVETNRQLNIQAATFSSAMAQAGTTRSVKNNPVFVKINAFR